MEAHFQLTVKKLELVHYYGLEKIFDIMGVVDRWPL